MVRKVQQKCWTFLHFASPNIVLSNQFNEEIKNMIIPYFKLKNRNIYTHFCVDIRIITKSNK